MVAPPGPLGQITHVEHWRGLFKLFDKRNVGDCSSFLWVVIWSPSTFIVAQVLSLPAFQSSTLSTQKLFLYGSWVHDTHSLKLTYHKVCNKSHPCAKGVLEQGSINELKFSCRIVCRWFYLSYFNILSSWIHNFNPSPISGERDFITFFNALLVPYGLGIQLHIFHILSSFLNPKVESLRFWE